MQEGSRGWRRAQEVYFKAGLAPEVMGSIFATEAGSGFLGKRIGDWNGGLLE